MSRADQSLTAPHRRRARRSRLGGDRARQRRAGADDEAELHLDVERRARAEHRRRASAPCAGRSAGRRPCPRPDRAGAPVVADRQVLPVGQQRLGVGPEQPADVRGVVLGGVEVDVVGDLERQVQGRRRGDSVRHGVRGSSGRREPGTRARTAAQRRGPCAMNGFSAGAANTSSPAPARAAGRAPYPRCARRRAGRRRRPRTRRRAGSSAPNGEPAGMSTVVMPLLGAAGRARSARQGVGDAARAERREPRAAAVTSRSRDQPASDRAVPSRPAGARRGPGRRRGEQQVEEPVLLEAGLRVGVAQRVVQPRGRLERDVGVDGAQIAAASSASDGYRSARTPPVRNFARWPVPASARSSGPRRLSRGISTYTGAVAADTASRTSSGPMPSGMAISSARRSTGRAGTAASTPGGCAGPPGSVTATGSGFSRGPSRSASASSAGAASTSGPTRSRYQAFVCPSCAATASGSGARPGGNTAASSHSPAKRSGITPPAPVRTRSTRSRGPRSPGRPRRVRAAGTCRP